MSWVKSIRRASLLHSVLVAWLVAVLAGTIYTAYYYQQVRDYLLQRSDEMAELITLSGQRNIVLTASRDPHTWLSTLYTTSWVEHVHLYQRTQSSAQLRFLGSYNKQGLAAIPVRRESQLEQIGPQLREDYIDVAKQITNNERVIGYVYLRSSRAPLDLVLLRGVIITSVISLLAILLSLLLARRHRRQTIDTLAQLTQQLRELSEHPANGKRLHDFDLRELDEIGLAINRLLGRYEQRQRRLEQRKNHAERRANDLTEQLAQRAKALSEANAEFAETLESLHQYQQQLVEAKKISSLREMVASIAHEVNTPVGLVITSLSIMNDQLDGLVEKVSSKQLTRAQLEQFIQQHQENLALVKRNIDRTAGLIARFSQLALDQFAEEPQLIELSTFCADLTASLQTRLEPWPTLSLKLQCSDTGAYLLKPGPINQILTQLVQNSIQHGFEDGQAGIIDIQLQVSDATADSAERQLQIRYHDNGRGIDNSLIDRIFDPFVSGRKDVGASGLGLYLVYNLVHQVLHGQIKVSSDSDSGTRFHITLPISV